MKVFKTKETIGRLYYMGVEGVLLSSQMTESRS